VAELTTNIVGSITDELKSQISTLLPTRKESAFRWSLEQNTSKGNKEVFALRPGSASTVSGTNRTITFDQDFTLILSNEFKNKGDNDAALDAAIQAIYQDLQTVYVEIYLRKLNIARVLVVQSITIDEPSIDNDNNIVNISLRFSVKYRTEI
jgi:hypothetical protein